MNNFFQQAELVVAYLLILIVVAGVKVLLSRAKVLVNHVQDVKAFVRSHTTANERAVLDALVKDAVPYISKLFPTSTVDDLLKKATDHVIAVAFHKGITVNEAEIQAAVSAVLDSITPATPIDQTQPLAQAPSSESAQPVPSAQPSA